MIDRRPKVIAKCESVGDVPRLYWPGYAYPPMAGEAFGLDVPDSLDADAAGADSAAAVAP